MKITEQAAASEVLDLDGNPLRLGTLWSDRSAVLAFLRHYGWLLCREQVARLAPRLDDIRAAGGELYAIGNGSIEAARAFCAEQQIAHPLFTDPSLRTFAAFGMRRDVLGLLRPGLWKNALRARRSGHRQTAARGDVFQNGGIVVVRTDGDIAYHHVETVAGEAPDVDAIVAALR